MAKRSGITLTIWFVAVIFNCLAARFWFNFPVWIRHWQLRATKWLKSKCISNSKMCSLTLALCVQIGSTYRSTYDESVAKHRQGWFSPRIIANNIREKNLQLQTRVFDVTLRVLSLFTNTTLQNLSFLQRKQNYKTHKFTNFSIVCFQKSQK